MWAHRKVPDVIIRWNCCSVRCGGRPLAAYIASAIREAF